jgi:uncharacterized membrane-anchored protein
MSAFATLALAALVVASTSADVPRDVPWILGPALVQLDGGRVRCALPEGVALASGPAAHSVLEVVSDGADGTELAVVAPTAPSRTWFVVVARQGVGAGEPQDPIGPAREGKLVWLERPRRDDRTGRVSWAFAGSSLGGPTVNQHVRIDSSGGAVLVTLVTPVEELGEARAHLARIVEGIVIDAGDRPLSRPLPRGGGEEERD